MLRKGIVVLFILLLTTPNVFGNTFDEKANLAVNTLNEERENLGIYGASYFDNKIYIVGGEITDSGKLKRIIEIAGDIDFSYCISDESVYNLKPYSMPVGKNYIVSEGIKYYIEHEAFINDGYFMMPLRDVINFLSDKNFNNYIFSIQYQGGDENIIEASTGTGSSISISIKNNTVEVPGKVKYKLEGEIALIDGVTYIPYTPDNFSFIFNESNYDRETETLNFKI